MPEAQMRRRWFAPWLVAIIVGMTVAGVGCSTSVATGISADTAAVEREAQKLREQHQREWDNK
jgi:hypothetical protein